MTDSGKMASRYRIRKNRRARRLRKQKGNRLRAWAGRFGKGVLSLATLASLAYLGFTVFEYVRQSGQLDVGEVKIMGCSNVLESELLNAAKVDFRSSLVKLDLEEVSRRIAQHPWIERANVRRDFSRKALVIEVQERVPRALILLDELYLVDAKGDIFKKFEAKDRIDFPILTGVSPKEWKEKDPQAVRLIGEALELLGLLRDRRGLSFREVSEIHLSRKNGLTLYTLKEGVPIRLGTGDYIDKLNRLEKVLPDLRNKFEKVEYLALNFPKKVVVKMKESGPEKARKS